MGNNFISVSHLKLALAGLLRFWEIVYENNSDWIKIIKIIHHWHLKNARLNETNKSFRFCIIRNAGKEMQALTKHTLRLKYFEYDSFVFHKMASMNTASVFYFTREYSTIRFVQLHARTWRENEWQEIVSAVFLKPSIDMECCSRLLYILCWPFVDGKKTSCVWLNVFTHFS